MGYIPQEAFGPLEIKLVSRNRKIETYFYAHKPTKRNVYPIDPRKVLGVPKHLVTRFGERFDEREKQPTPGGWVNPFEQEAADNLARLCRITPSPIEKENCWKILDRVRHLAKSWPVRPVKIR